MPLFTSFENIYNFVMEDNSLDKIKELQALIDNAKKINLKE